MTATINTAIFSHLTSVGSITELVGDRVYPTGVSPAVVIKPYITYQKISNVHERHLRGGSGITTVRIQINCWAEKSSEADQLFDRVREAMDNFTGLMGQGSGALPVRATFLEDDADAFVPPTDRTNRGVFGVQMDFLIVYKESLTPA